jgi:hypothetical protein
MRVTDLLDFESEEKKQVRADRLRESLSLLLEGRFPTEVTPDLISRLQTQKDSNVLEHWFLSALRIQSLRDFRELLEEDLGIETVSHDQKDSRNRRDGPKY